MALVKILGEKTERDNVLNISLVQICIRRGNSPFMLVYVEGIASVGKVWADPSPARRDLFQPNLEAALSGDWEVMGIADCRSAAEIRVDGRQ